MGKKYHNSEADALSLAEPAGVYNISSPQDTQENTSIRKNVMASTVSVDEYFDELISLVHKDYASLWGEN